MKILFTDIDGVLNSLQYDRQKSSEQGNIDETRLPLLKRIVDETQAKIVLSSSWREHWHRDEALCDAVGKDIVALFAKYQLTIFDKTPKRPDNDRAREIGMWLGENGPIARFAILDDIAWGWEELQPYLVRTNARIGRGLEARHVQQAIDLLNGGEEFIKH